MQAMSCVTCDRRAFIGLCASVALAGCASLAVRPVTPVDGRIELQLRLYPELGSPGGAVKLQPVGSENPVYVLTLDDGSIAALSPICTHLGCTVDIQGPRLVCPCHGSTYERDGRVVQGPAERNLARYATERIEGALIIHLERRA